MKRGGFLKRTTPLRAKPTKRRKKSDLQKLKAKLWELCRQITRKRYGNTCYTCDKTGLEGSSWQTGHFISSSICSVALRYDLRNLRIQCYNCNINKSGNWLEFENRLKRDCGEAIVAELKAENERTKGQQYDSLWYEAKIAEYQLIFDNL